MGPPVSRGQLGLLGCQSLFTPETETIMSLHPAHDGDFITIQFPLVCPFLGPGLTHCGLWQVPRCGRGHLPSLPPLATMELFTFLTV